MPQLALLVDGVVSQIFILEEGDVTIGRSTEADIYVDDVSVSTRHAVISVSPNELLEGHLDIFIEDLRSRNGTLVNDERIRRSRLRANDIVRIGWNKFKLLDDRTASRETTALMVLD